MVDDGTSGPRPADERRRAVHDDDRAAGDPPPAEPVVGGEAGASGDAAPLAARPEREPWSWRQIFGMILCVSGLICGISLIWQEGGLRMWGMGAASAVLAWAGVWALVGGMGMARSVALVVLGGAIGGGALAIDWYWLSWFAFGAAAGALFHWGYGKGKRGFWFTTSLMFLAYGGLAVFGLLRVTDRGLMVVIVQGLLSIGIGWWLTRDRSRKDDRERDRALYWIGTALLFFGRVLLPYLALTMVVLLRA